MKVRALFIVVVPANEDPFLLPGDLAFISLESGTGLTKIRHAVHLVRRYDSNDRFIRLEFERRCE